MSDTRKKIEIDRIYKIYRIDRDVVIEINPVNLVNPVYILWRMKWLSD